MVTGIEVTRSSILEQIVDKLDRIDCDGGSFDRVTREKVENAVKVNDTLQAQFTVFMKGQTAMQNGILSICYLTAGLAIMAGGTLIWNIIKAFLKI